MATATIVPSADDALIDSYEPPSIIDPNTYLPANSPTVNIAGRNVLVPLMNEILALIGGRGANADYYRTFTCGSGDMPTSPVYLSADLTVASADATTDAKAAVIGFIQHKFSSTTCRVTQLQARNGLTGGVYGAPVYLKNDGTLGSSPGTKTKVIGMYLDATTALCFGSPESARLLKNDNIDASAAIAGSKLNLADQVYAAGTSSGIQIGTASNQKLGLLGATPVAQRSGAAQTAVVATAATQTTPWGFSTQSQADSIVTLLNEIRAGLVALGAIKGSA